MVIQFHYYQSNTYHIYFILKKKKKNIYVYRTHRFNIYKLLNVNRYFLL